MEGDGEDQGDAAQSVSGTESAQADALIQSCSDDSTETPDLQHRACDETVTHTNTEEDAERLSQDEDTPPSLPLSPHPSQGTQDRTSEPCWYCMRSLDLESQPETSTQEDSNPSSPLPSSGQKVSYQTDPRPHFGVTWSSHSTCRPLWGSEGPCWGQRSQEVGGQMHTCPHCHLGLTPDTLRWHEAKCLLFEGLRNSNN